ncbi:enoyl-CoA hydratase [Alteromonas sp. ASW11-130]|uniref:enoyl-CoA hydratase n=1 Tax=Alteromonas sp. ASW11-130 TaxID=3015775 RepID=UPI00224229FB|nr:enoyl-CoA hydratase [Alteromonas sp. ASW11-130]MCW8092455.1 enoyl-CoA hydratase [Alteromonas sp. ASW11-130]
MSIQINTEKGVMRLTLNREDKKNSLTRDMYRQLADAIIQAGDDESVKVIRIDGAGSCFTAGNDIHDFASQNHSDNVTDTVAFMQALVECEKVVVAQVHGLAVGIGTTLLLHCDLVYCAPDTRFILPFINLGLVPEYASSYLLPRMAGRRKASEWLMLGEPIEAQEAMNFGIVSRIVDSDRLEGTVSAICQALVGKPAFALTQTKQLMSNDTDAVLQQMNAELDVFLEAMTTDAAKEAFSAFLEKRPVDRNKFK